MESYSDNFDHRPSIGFHFGLTLLLVLLFTMTAFFTCCIHWEKIRSFVFSSPDDDHQRHFNSDVEAQKAKQNRVQCVPVLMPGDEVPKFIAMSCPCKPVMLDRRFSIDCTLC